MVYKQMMFMLVRADGGGRWEQRGYLMKSYYHKLLVEELDNAYRFWILGTPRKEFFFTWLAPRGAIFTTRW